MTHSNPTTDSALRSLVDYYRFLGVPPTARTEQIVEAYLVKVQDPDGRVQERAERALALLSDATKRQEYDRALAAHRAARDAQPPGRPGKSPADPAAGAGPAAPSRTKQGPGSRSPARSGVRPSAGGPYAHAQPRPSPLTWVGGIVGIVVLLAFGWVLVAGGGNAGTNSRAKAQPLGILRSTTASGDFQLALTVAPDPPRPGPTTFTLQVQDRSGQPMSSAQVTWAMDMTNMSMGRQTGQMTNLGAGQYQARADFDMGGPWRINIAVANAGQALGSGFFDLQIR